MLFLDGKTFNVPDVYGVLKIINEGAVALPNFNVGLIVAKQLYGIPYSAGGANNGGTLIRGYSDVQLLRRDYGSGTEMETAFKYAKRMGAGVIFVLGVNPLIQAVATLTDITPTASIDIKSDMWGAVGNDISITIATATGKTTITVIPPKNEKMLTANSGTDDTVEVTNIDGLNVGDTVFLTDNVYAAPVSKVIKQFIKTSTGYQIQFTAAISASALIANYARIFQEDLDRQGVGAWLAADYTLSAVQAFLDGLGFLSASVSASAVAPPTDLAKTYIQNITAATKGTSIIATDTVGGSWDTCAAALPQLLDEFELSNKLTIRLINIVTSVAGNHGSFKSLAATMRANNKAVNIIAGCALGDVLLQDSDSSNPKKRAFALNSDDFILAGDGHEGLAPYLTHAPEVLGAMVASSPNHNLTRDILPVASTEKFFGKSNEQTEVAAYLRAGVMITYQRKDGFHMAQGINTYQYQTSEWNQDTGKTYLIFNRTLADYVLAGLMEEMDTLIGADGVTKDGAQRAAILTLEDFKLNGFITDYRITAITQTGNSWTVKCNVTLPGITDFIGIIVNIVVP